MTFVTKLPSRKGSSFGNGGDWAEVSGSAVARAGLWQTTDITGARNATFTQMAIERSSRQLRAITVGIEGPQTDPPSITLRGNRIKHVPAAIIFAPLAVFFAVPLWAVFSADNSSAHLGGAWFGVSFLLAFFLIGLLVELRLIAGIIWPERIVLTVDGWTTVRVGRAITRRWTDFDEAKEGMVSTGRASQPCIRLAPKNGGKPVNILTLGYAYSMYDLLKTIRFAQGGRLVDPGEEDFPWSYVLMGIPLSFIVVIAAIIFIGPRFVASFHW